MPRPKKKTTKTEEPAPRKAWDLLSMGPSLIAQTEESLAQMRSKRKTQVSGFMSYKDFKKFHVPFKHLYDQCMYQLIGLPSGAIHETLAAEGLGKTTRMLSIMGDAMETSGTPCLYVETENKPLREDRVLRCLSKYKDKAKAMLNVLAMEQAFEFKHMVKVVEDWVLSVRTLNENPVPIHIPVIVGIDTISKLMSSDEAKDYYSAYGMEAGKDDITKAREVGESSNLQISKLHHAWCRRLAYFAKKFNVLFLVNSHQNEKVVMTFGGGGSFGGDSAAKFNKTRPGGKALDQNTTTQTILYRTGFHKKGTDKIGHKISAYIAKNTLGDNTDREVNYYLLTKHFTDTDSTQERAIDMNEEFCNMLVEEKLFGAKVSRKRFTSNELNLENLEADDFYEELSQNPGAVKKLAQRNNIYGYDFVTTEDKPIVDDASEDDPEEANKDVLEPLEEGTDSDSKDQDEENK